MFDLEKLEKEIRDDRQIKALIGLSLEEFNLLEELYEILDKDLKDKAYQSRKKENTKARRSSKGNPGKLDSYKKKVFFSLYYLKTYPTYDVMGFSFGMDRSTVCVNLKLILPTLKLLFRKLGIAPKREINSVEDLKDAFDGDILDLIVDGTERKHFRHKDYSEQKKTIVEKRNVIQKKI